MELDILLCNEYNWHAVSASTSDDYNLPAAPVSPVTPVRPIAPMEPVRAMYT